MRIIKIYNYIPDAYSGLLGHKIGLMFNTINKNERKYVNKRCLKGRVK